MSAERNPEIVGCNASIMRNAWEIREREYGAKMQQEQERKVKSALSSINKEWENRMAVRQGKGTRVGRPVKPVENLTDIDNIWKDKQPLVPPTLPRGPGSGLATRPGSQMRDKDKKGRNKSLNRLQLVMSITQTQPSTMVWGKSWKNNRALPSPVEDAAAPSDWGKCWMFAARQPHSEPGKPWLNGPNMMDPQSLHLWKKPGCRVLKSQELDVILPAVEWQTSWRKSNRRNKRTETEESVHKPELFTLLVETQHHNEALCSSEWSDSWRSTKPTSQQYNSIPNDSHVNESYAKVVDEDTEWSSEWEECWQYVNHLGSKKINLSKNLMAHSSKWADSWRAAMAVCNNHNNSDPSLRQDHHQDSYDDHNRQKESHLQKVVLLSHEQKSRDLCLQLCSELASLSEWSKAWQVTKKHSKPCEEIEKLLKMENNLKGHDSASEKNGQFNEPLKYDVIFPKREFSNDNLLHNKHLRNVLSHSEWRDSWQTLKHRMRVERRRSKPDPLRPFRDFETGADSVWKDSWRFTCQPVRQEPELWQQGWLTTPQIREERAREHNHFAPVELPKNGPTGERSWGESWRFWTPQNLQGPRQDRRQTNLERSSVVCHHLDDSLTHRSNRGASQAQSVSDWQEAWMVSETQFHHDRPSLIHWRDAWRCSLFNAEQWSQQRSREDGVGMFSQIPPQKESMSLQKGKYKASRSSDYQMFREIYPEEEWSASWRAGSLFNQLSYYGSSGKPGKSMTQQQHVSDNGHGSQWGMSFRIANPMPRVEKPWVECSPNQSHYKVMWSRGKNMQNNIIANFSIPPANIRHWAKSHWFSALITDQTTSRGPADHWVIITNTAKARMHLFSKSEQEEQSDRKWPGCHLWAKIQPRPKRGTAPLPKLKMEDGDKEFFKEWAESWRFQPGGLKRLMPITPLTGWEESWQFVLPLYQPRNGHKVK